MVERIDIERALDELAVMRRDSLSRVLPSCRPSSAGLSSSPASATKTADSTHTLPLLSHRMEEGKGWRVRRLAPSPKSAHSVRKAALSAGLLVDNPKLVADQLGHTVDVNQNVYTRASVARRKEAVDALPFM